MKTRPSVLTAGTATVRTLFVLLAPLLLAYCAAIPRRSAAVDSVRIDGTHEVDSGDIEAKMATAPSPKFLGLFRGVVYDYEIFNQAVLQTDLQRIERYYRARGFYKARVRAGRVFYVDDKHVRVQIEVEEGPPVIVRRLTLRGLRGLPPEIAESAARRARAALPLGERFDEDVFLKAENDLRRALTDEGYAHAKVTRLAEVDLPRDRASLAFEVQPGKRARFGEVHIEGLGDVPEAPVRRALDIEPGTPYSTASIESAQQALLELGVFSQVRIDPMLDPSNENETVIPLRVSVRPARLRGVQLGGGVQIDALRADVHLLAGWEHRNFLGGLRRFTVQFRPGVALYPTRVPDFQAPTNLLPEEKLRSELRQPGFIEARTNGFVRGEFNIYPLLLTPDVDKSAPVIGYRETRGAVGVDRTFGRLLVSLLHNVQSNIPFVYKGDLDPDLGPVLVSYPELLATLDFRDDRVQPHAGAYLSNDLQVAGLGGDARDFKIQPDLRGYVPVTKHVTLALRTSVGFLFTQNYGSTLEDNASGAILTSNTPRAKWVEDVQLSLLRGFFSGGPSSNRGYALREVGPHGVVPFYNPGLGRAQLATHCNPTSSDYNPADCKLPLGGRTLWEASLELRFPLTGPLSGASFCDSSDVSPSEVDIRLNRPHLSCGLGFRYDTPVGPIRLDVGYRIPGLQAPASATGEGSPGTIFGLPMAIAFGIGEAF